MRSALFAVVAMSFLVACSSSKNRTDESALKQRARDAATATFGGDAKTSYGYFSKHCRERVSLTEYRATLKVADAFLEGFSGVKLKDLEVDRVDVKDLREDSALVSVHVRSKADPDVDVFGDEQDFSEWRVEDGKWVETDCSSMSFDSDAEEATPAAPAATAPTARPANTPGPSASPTAVKKPKIGEAAVVKGGKFTVNALRDNLPGSQFEKPPAGQRWLGFDVTIEATADGLRYNPLYFSLQDADAYGYEAKFISAGPVPPLSTGQLNAGDKIRGWVFFEVPAAASLFALRVQPDPTSSAIVVIADLAGQ